MFKVLVVFKTLTTSDNKLYVYIYIYKERERESSQINIIFLKFHV